MSAQSWAISREEPGQIHATRIVNGKHEMRVLVSYDDVSVRIEYEDSKNLKYSKSRSGKETIHQNYMRWTTNLRWEILQRLSDQRAAKPDLPD